ncbi:mrna export factor elf1 [Rozella allomycis CSF55]|uniref:Mrna export factor elf1 n=1 Tax=Rozella allomycis (strain CSF55) TaxID=988480 RepID=A0A4P9YJQ1_ROZAC|nr:mrna export factor elf1 [Rozella allomycis CSF55]
MKLKKGRRYGLCGRNGVGKTTLMRAISEGKVEGFPVELKTVLVEHALQGENGDLALFDFVLENERIKNIKREKVENALIKVGFGKEMFNFPVKSLSGGMKMKLELAKAILLEADILLLDEPTNHLDEANVKWLEEYLLKCKITCLIVSHDSAFLDNVCSDIIHYETKKLVNYPGNLSAFVKIKPEAKAYYTLSSDEKFVFPKPAFLAGVKSQTKAILKMNNVTFKYPSRETAALVNVSCQLSLSSRVGIIGQNGAGKSTLIKLMTGELIPDSGLIEKHPNLRIGYVAQYAFHHLEQHKDDTPAAYLRWRYQGGEDREILLKASRKLTPEEEKLLEKPISINGQSRFVECIFGRQKLKKSFQYEIKWKNLEHRWNTWIPREELIENGFSKLVQAFDDYEASREGLGYRELTHEAICKHFQDVGLDPSIALHNSISGLSGGQKVKVVIAACMWNNPHLLVLDEPTNFLDRDALGGLATAIRDWGGAVVMISHNSEFIKALCPEIWNVANSKLVISGKRETEESLFEDSQNNSSEKDSNNDSVVKNVKNKKKKLTRNQLKAQAARRRERELKWLIDGGKGKLLHTDDEESDS